MAADEEGVVVRRNRPGIKNSELYGWPEQDYTEMDSILDVQQHIQQMVRHDPSDVEAILEPPPTQNNEACWKYEHLRQFCNQLNGIAVRLQIECDPKQCVQMTATEQWIFLCAAHKDPKECSALDYTLHTLHGAASLLNSSKHFPSRFDIKESSIQRLSSVARRVYRIFAHTYFHHRSLFDEFEAETHLCRRFTRFVTKYELMSPENLMVPMETDPNESSA